MSVSMSRKGNLEKIGQIIKSLRESRNLTQDALAEEIGCTKQSIYRYEKDQSLIETHTLIKLSLSNQCQALRLFGYHTYQIQ